MNTSSILVPACLILFAAAGRAQVWDARADFSTNSNPNGPWNYAWSPGLTHPPVRFPRFHVPAVNNGMQQIWDDPGNSNGFTPSVSINAGGDYNNGNVTFNAGALILHGCGTSGRDYAHVIWTAPSADRYRLTGWFYAQQNWIQADVHVLLNGQPIFSGVITANGQILSFSRKLSLAAGDTLGFSVGPGGVFFLHEGNVGLEAILERMPAWESSIRVSEVEICWPSVTNTLYRVEYRSEVTGPEWLPLYTDLPGTGERMCVTDRPPPNQPQRYYRVINPSP
jgi:hypothetical protein